MHSTRGASKGADDCTLAKIQLPEKVIYRPISSWHCLPSNICTLRGRTYCERKLRSYLHLYEVH